jgi:hypothetical protein
MGNTMTVEREKITHRDFLGRIHRDGDLPAVEYNNGDKLWYKRGKVHRSGDLPAFEKADGSKQWCKNGLLHRDNDRPAIEYVNGDREWRVNGLRHRDNDRPAVEFANGDREWWVNGLRHRDNDRPAIEFANGDREWWVNGEMHREGDNPAVENINGQKQWWVRDKRYRESGPVVIDPIQGERWGDHGGWTTAKLPDGTPGVYDKQTDSFIFENGSILKHGRVVSDEKETVHELKCDVCMEHRKCIALSCGHVYCTGCAYKVAICPSCRMSISSRNRIYL